MRAPQGLKISYRNRQTRHGQGRNQIRRETGRGGVTLPRDPGGGRAVGSRSRATGWRAGGGVTLPRDRGGGRAGGLRSRAPGWRAGGGVALPRDRVVAETPLRRLKLRCWRHGRAGARPHRVASKGSINRLDFCEKMLEVDGVVRHEETDVEKGLYFAVVML